MGVNYFVCNKYNDQNDGVTSSYGLIRGMFITRLHVKAEPEVVVECDWYLEFESARRTPLGLPQVSYAPTFESERLGFLGDCRAYNLVLWPTNPFKKVRLNTGAEIIRIDLSVDTTPGRLYTVITHHQLGLNT